MNIRDNSSTCTGVGAFSEKSGILSYTLTTVQRLNCLMRRRSGLCPSISQHVRQSYNEKNLVGSLAHEESFSKEMFASTNDYSYTNLKKKWKKQASKSEAYRQIQPVVWKIKPDSGCFETKCHKLVKKQCISSSLDTAFMTGMMDKSSAKQNWEAEMKQLMNCEDAEEVVGSSTATHVANSNSTTRGFAAEAENNIQKKPWVECIASKPREKAGETHNVAFITGIMNNQISPSQNWEAHMKQIAKHSLKGKTVSQTTPACVAKKAENIDTKNIGIEICKTDISVARANQSEIMMKKSNLNSKRTQVKEKGQTVNSPWERSLKPKKQTAEVNKETNGTQKYFDGRRNEIDDGKKQCKNFHNHSMSETGKLEKLEYCKTVPMASGFSKGTCKPANHTCLKRTMSVHERNTDNPPKTGKRVSFGEVTFRLIDPKQENCGMNDRVYLSKKIDKATGKIPVGSLGYKQSGPGKVKDKIMVEALKKNPVTKFRKKGHMSDIKKTAKELKQAMASSENHVMEKSHVSFKHSKEFRKKKIENKPESSTADNLVGKMLQPISDEKTHKDLENQKSVPMKRCFKNDKIACNHQTGEEEETEPGKIGSFGETRNVNLSENNDQARQIEMQSDRNKPNELGSVKVTSMQRKTSLTTIEEEPRKESEMEKATNRSLKDKLKNSSTLHVGVETAFLSSVGKCNVEETKQVLGKPIITSEVDWQKLKLSSEKKHLNDKVLSDKENSSVNKNIVSDNIKNDTRHKVTQAIEAANINKAITYANSKDKESKTKCLKDRHNSCQRDKNRTNMSPLQIQVETVRGTKIQKSRAYIAKCVSDNGMTEGTSDNESLPDASSSIKQVLDSNDSPTPSCADSIEDSFSVFYYGVSRSGAKFSHKTDSHSKMKVKTTSKQVHSPATKSETPSVVRQSNYLDTKIANTTSYKSAITSVNKPQESLANKLHCTSSIITASSSALSSQTSGISKCHATSSGLFAQSSTSSSTEVSSTAAKACYPRKSGESSANKSLPNTPVDFLLTSKANRTQTNVTKTLTPIKSPNSFKEVPALNLSVKSQISEIPQVTTKIPDNMYTSADHITSAANNKRMAVEVSEPNTSNCLAAPYAPYGLQDYFACTTTSEYKPKWSAVPDTTPASDQGTSSSYRHCITHSKRVQELNSYRTGDLGQSQISKPLKDLPVSNYGTISTHQPQSAASEWLQQYNVINQSMSYTIMNNNYATNHWHTYYNPQCDTINDRYISGIYSSHHSSQRGISSDHLTAVPIPLHHNSQSNVGGNFVHHPANQFVENPINQWSDIFTPQYRIYPAHHPDFLLYRYQGAHFSSDNTPMNGMNDTMAFLDPYCDVRGLEMSNSNSENQQFNSYQNFGNEVRDPLRQQRNFTQSDWSTSADNSYFRFSSPFPYSNPENLHSAMPWFKAENFTNQQAQVDENDRFQLPDATVSNQISISNMASQQVSNISSFMWPDPGNTNSLTSGDNQYTKESGTSYSNSDWMDNGTSTFLSEVNNSPGFHHSDGLVSSKGTSTPCVPLVKHTNELSSFSNNLPECQLSDSSFEIAEADTYIDSVMTELKTSNDFCNAPVFVSSVCDRLPATSSLSDKLPCANNGTDNCLDETACVSPPVLSPIQQRQPVDQKLVSLNCVANKPREEIQMPFQHVSTTGEDIIVNEVRIETYIQQRQEKPPLENATEIAAGKDKSEEKTIFMSDYHESGELQDDAKGASFEDLKLNDLDMQSTNENINRTMDKVVKFGESSLRADNSHKNSQSVIIESSITVPQVAVTPEPVNKMKSKSSSSISGLELKVNTDFKQSKKRKFQHSSSLYSAAAKFLGEDFDHKIPRKKKKPSLCYGFLDISKHETKIEKVKIRSSTTREASLSSGHTRRKQNMSVKGAKNKTEKWIQADEVSELANEHNLEENCLQTVSTKACCQEKRIQGRPNKQAKYFEEKCCPPNLNNSEKTSPIKPDNLKKNQCNYIGTEKKSSPELMIKLTDIMTNMEIQTNPGDTQNNNIKTKNSGKSSKHTEDTVPDRELIENKDQNIRRKRKAGSRKENYSRNKRGKNEVHEAVNIDNTVDMAGETKCPLCDLELLSTEFRGHMRKTHPRYCEECFKEFPNKKIKQKHKVDHAAEVYHCVPCDRKFIQKYHLQAHLKFCKKRLAAKSWVSDVEPSVGETEQAVAALIGDLNTDTEQPVPVQMYSAKDFPGFSHSVTEDEVQQDETGSLKLDDSYKVLWGNKEAVVKQSNGNSFSINVERDGDFEPQFEYYGCHKDIQYLNESDCQVNFCFDTQLHKSKHSDINTPLGVTEMEAYNSAVDTLSYDLRFCGLNILADVCELETKSKTLIEAANNDDHCSENSAVIEDAKTDRSTTVSALDADVHIGDNSFQESH